jgi:hypothetical protein
VHERGDCDGQGRRGHARCSRALSLRAHQAARAGCHSKRANRSKRAEKHKAHKGAGGEHALALIWASRFLHVARSFLA